MYVCVGGSNDKYVTNIEKVKSLFHLAGGEKDKTEFGVIGWAVCQCLGRLDDFYINIPLVLWKLLFLKCFPKQ